MARVTNCKTCKGKVSTEAKTCPHCGQPNPADWCFIATVVYDSVSAPEVQLLRNYRDSVLLCHGWGKALVQQYYKYSPPIAAWLQTKSFLRLVIRKVLDVFIFLVVTR
jgi:RNA polymerase subunit RPABC4/transcription elongation factor Spt4